MNRKTYRANEDQWSGENGKTVKIAGKKIPGADPAKFIPDSDKRAGEIFTGSGKKSEPDADYVSVNGKFFELKPLVSKGRFFKKKAAWIKVDDYSGGTVHATSSDDTVTEAIGSGSESQLEKYVQVVKVRGAAVLACIVAVLVVVLIAFSLATGVAPQDAPAYFADATGITHNNADAHATIEYATYESTPDQTWKAGETHQDMVLRLPAEATSKDENGNDVTNDNPVIAAPHVYVDINGDGRFSDDELVFNPIDRNQDGTVKSYGEFLEPGQQIDGVDLTQTLQAGTYDAETLWTPLSKGDNSEANPMTFKWRLTVE